MEGDKFGEKIGECVGISIHSLRMEGDYLCRRNSADLPEFQSTPSAWRETEILPAIHPIDRKFQSTPSAWRETRWRLPLQNLSPYFNPLPPHGGRQPFPHLAGQVFEISIHSLHTEGDAIRILVQKCQPYFNPLPPHGGRPSSNRLP